jgi:two-component system, LytTR family, sensor kinase
MTTFAKRFALVFALWTLVALCGGLADYLFAFGVGKPMSFWAAFQRPLTEQWIWAALTPLVFFVAHHFPLGRPHLARAIAAHVAAFLSLSFLHCVLAEGVGGPLAYLPAHYTGATLPLRFLEEFYSDIWMYWPLVCIQALIDSHARARDRERHTAELEASLAKSHLALLRAQIQPHFLFNTLHALSALIRVDPVAAEDMVADLAEILRASSVESGLQETTLRRELDLVSCYVRIQQRRFGERLRVNQILRFRRWCCNLWWKMPSRMELRPLPGPVLLRFAFTAARNSWFCRWRMMASGCRAKAPAERDWPMPDVAWASYTGIGSR